MLASVTDATLIVPGHGGPASNRMELGGYRDMLVDVRGKVATLKRQGRSLEDTLAAKPTAAFDPEWGQGIVSPASFAKLVYAGV